MLEVRSAFWNIVMLQPFDFQAAIDVWGLTSPSSLAEAYKVSYEAQGVPL